MSARGTRRAVFVCAAALGAVHLTLVLASPSSIGIWGDDAVYVVTARSLAEGEGYRHAEVPGQPHQTKYPILYPALLSLVFRAAPDFPGNAKLLVAPNVLASVGVAVLGALICRVVLGASTRMAWVAGGLTAFSPVVLAFVRYTMSELLYACLAAGALLCLDGGALRAGSRRSARGWIATGALLAGLAALSRSIGVTLAAAAVAAPLLHRRAGDAALAAGVVALCLLPWMLWQSSSAEGNGTLQTAFLVASDLDYGVWTPSSLPDAFRVVHQNLFRAIFGIGYFQLALPPDFVREAFAGSLWRTGVVHLVCYTAVAFTIIGFARSVRGGVCTLHLYALAYAGLVIAWPFSPYRFLVPWTPFLLYFLLEGGVTAARFAGARIGSEGAAERWAARAPVALALLLAALFAGEAARIAGGRADAYYLRETSADLTEREALEEWVRRHVGDDDVVASYRPARLFLATGRRGANFWTDNDPVAEAYGPDRRWPTFYAVPDSARSPSSYRDMRDNLGRVYRDAEITWYVEYAHAPQTADLARLVRERPSWFQLRYSTPGGLYRVYRVTL